MVPQARRDRHLVSRRRHDSWDTPLNNNQGKIAKRPNRESRVQPDRIITSTDDVLVHDDHGVKRFKVTRIGGGGRFEQIRVDDESAQRIREALAPRANNNETLQFDE